MFQQYYIYLRLVKFAASVLSTLS